MDRTYLQEAFHAMELLEEEDFRLDDVGVKDILDFKDHDELNDIVDVVDPEADTEEELEDTYIGKVILECEVCHSPIFKNVEDVEIEEDSDVANVADECPICHSNDGFKVIGQVCPFEEEPELKVEIEDKPADEDGNGEFDALEDEEEFKESLNEEWLHIDNSKPGQGKVARAKKALEDADIHCDKTMEDREVERCNKEQVNGIPKNESLNEARTRELYDEVYNELSATKTGVRNQYKIPANKGERYADGDGMADKDDAKNKLELSAYNGDVPEGFAAIKVMVTDPARLDFAKKVADHFANDGVKYRSLFGGHKRFGDYCGLVLVPMNESLNEATKKSNVDLSDKDSVVALLIDNKDEIFNAPDAKELKRIIHRTVQNKQDTPWTKEFLAKIDTQSYMEMMKYVTNVILKGGSKVRNGYYYGESLSEGFEKVDLEMEDKIIHVSEEPKEPIPDAEMIAPVSDDLEAELMSDENAEMPAEEAPIDDLGAEEIPADDLAGEEAPADDLGDLEGEEIPEDEELADEEPEEFDGEESLKKDEAMQINESVDYDITDFDENAFNKLGEGYLKKVYENVEGFNTSSVKVTEQKLIVEGNIKFNSGKEKATSFIFEAKDATKDGKVRFIGENKQISRGKKSFTLTGMMNNNNFMAESLNYNYRQKTNEGVSTRVYGTIKLNESKEVK